MTTVHVRFHPSATAEAEAAARWYEERGAGLGSDFVAELERVVEIVLGSPRAWPPSAADDRARFAPFSRFPYCVVFLLVNDGELVVVAVAHGKRRPGFWRSRVPAAVVPEDSR